MYCYLLSCHYCLYCIRISHQRDRISHRSLTSEIASPVTLEAPLSAVAAGSELTLADFDGESEAAGKDAPLGEAEVAARDHARSREIRSHEITRDHARSHEAVGRQRDHTRSIRDHTRSHEITRDHTRSHAIVGARRHPRWLHLPTAPPARGGAVRQMRRDRISHQRDRATLPIAAPAAAPSPIVAAMPLPQPPTPQPWPQRPLVCLRPQLAHPLLSHVLSVVAPAVDAAPPARLTAARARARMSSRQCRATSASPMLLRGGGNHLHQCVTVSE